MSDDTIRISLLFADEGAFHHESMTIPAGVLDGYDRLIDCLREEPEVLKRTYVDVDRLVSAQVDTGD